MPDIPPEKIETEVREKEKEPKRLWWEIPARSSLFFLILLIMIPSHWYRAAYLYTIGYFFPETIESRIEDFGEEVHKRLSLKELPTEARIVILKAEKQVELWGKDKGGTWRKLNYYPIFTLPEATGPKCQKDDEKTPEGVYRLKALTPNHIHYIALKLDYPSQEDKEIAKEEDRPPESLGDEFALHGFGSSSGNIALHDKAMEEIFYITAKVGLEKTKVIITPFDFRYELFPEATQPEWLLKRYQEIDTELKPLLDKTKQKKREEKEKKGGKKSCRNRQALR